MILRSNTTILAAPYCPEMVAQAKAWVSEKGYTAEDVRIYRPAWTEEYGDQVLVVAKRDLG